MLFLLIIRSVLFINIATVANGEGNAVLQQAEAGDAEAQNTVGKWCYNGSNGMEHDYVAALQWWAKAAKQGNVEAVGNMGMCYRYGHGVERDSVRAMQLYLKSIKDGNDSLFIPSLDAEAKRICKQLKFRPAVDDGHAVASKYLLAIEFRLPKEKEKPAVTAPAANPASSQQGKVKNDEEKQANDDKQEQNPTRPNPEEEPELTNTVSV